MSNILTKAALPLAALVLGAGLAAAGTQLDPMGALAGRPAGSDPLDPMTAMRAKAEASDASAGNDEFGGLPDGAGAEETYYQCVACHSTEIIKQQRVSDHRWDELWTWMVEAQGMAEPDAGTKQTILTYLKQNFSSQR
ncbi:cytochrome C-552 [Paracoccus sp. CPCC 101403]|uniref:Cytochrome C-552 n=1 Tax=Paracoccus broussonetiae TaxID=3075834 RepID=A0ABU3EJX4_9RHOB|nr:cytochrome C-552 [Paracoccus sp. CPCC 101403]MDT1064538.1 cytochrome C-552 [Paracoccus sp. CPCC 101403]